MLVHTKDIPHLQYAFISNHFKVIAFCNLDIKIEHFLIWPRPCDVILNIILNNFLFDSQPLSQTTFKLYPSEILISK